MLSACEGAGVEVELGTEVEVEVPGRGAESGSHGKGLRGAQAAAERRQQHGVREWSDGSTYEGELLNGLKHGKGKYTWSNGEYYEGWFYKDYRHGDGLYCWPTGHKFIGKFYLNRKEGYGQQLFPDGTDFQGLYHADQRLGPGVVTYPDGRQDVGLWLQERLIKFCTSVEDSFSLENFPEYAAYVDPAARADDRTQPPSYPCDLQTVKSSEVDAVLLSDDNFILPPGIEGYSTDGDHLPLPPGRRRELDRLFYGDLWEPDTYPHQGFERDPLSTLPLQARMQALIYKHRLQVCSVGWDVASVLSLNRDSFGPKGPLEISSELLIQQASRGEQPAVLQILQSGLVHPDVADSQGHTALIAATVNCHDDVIQLLLDMGADIDLLNCDGMSALAVCHLLYYPFQSLHTTLVEPPAKTQLLRSQVMYTSSHHISSVDFAPDTPRPPTNDTVLSSQNNQSHFSDETTEDLTEQRSHHSDKVSCNSELITEQQGTDLNEPETPVDTKHLKQEETEEKGGEDEARGCRERDSKGNIEKNEESSFKKNVENKREELQMKGGFQFSEEAEKDVEETPKDFHEKDIEQKEEGIRRRKICGVERSIQVMDGHIPLGTVKWKEYGAKVKNKESQKAGFGSARSIHSYNIHVTEEVLHHSAEALSRTGIPQHSHTQETARKMAAMKIEHRVRLTTLQLLLSRGADPNVSRIPMPVIFLAVMAADAEAVRRLLLCGARTDIPLPPRMKGLYPLHVAAALPGPVGPRITELLLHALADPDARACDQDEIYEQDKAIDLKNTTGRPDPREGGRTALHVACQRDSDYLNASKVTALLVSHRARTDLLWSGHSPLSLAIASGNELAVEELLTGGADPNVLLGNAVGSALCALANINYHLCGDRLKLLDMLAKAGADITIPVTVGDLEGTAVDYAHYSFSQDSHIANTPFHALNMRERETFKTRRKLLGMMGNLLRQTATQRERGKHLTADSTNSQKGPIHSDDRMHLFKFCYHCGRSVSVKLTECSRCHKVFFCSRTCKLKAWNGGHKEECSQESGSADGIQKRVVFKSQKPMGVPLKPKKVSEALSIKMKPHMDPKLLNVAENVFESQVNTKENYSFI